MKRKPSTVSVILFILVFVMLYFIEQKLHILASSANPVINVEVDSVNSGQASFDFNILEYFKL